MELSFKITAGLLLLVQVLQPVSLQNSTDSAGWVVDPSWLREPGRSRTPRPVVAIPEDGDEGSDPTLDPSHDYSSGITSGSMSTLSEEDQNKDADEELDDASVVTTPELPGDLNLNVSATTPDSSNVTDFEREFNDSSATSPNSTATSVPAENSTHWSNHSQNHSTTTTSAPGVNATQELTPTLTTPAGGAPSTNATEPTETGTTEVSETSTSFGSATTFQPSTSSGRSLRTTSLHVHDTPEAANKTGTAPGSGSGSERGGLSCFHLTLA